MIDTKVHLEIFEGPLDLLLYLVKKQEVDIYQVNLTRIAAQFVEYIEMMRRLDLDVAGEFLVMAATLVYIKSRELLPVEQQVPAEEEEDADDPRWELIRQLVEYKKFKDAAAELHQREALQEQVYPRIPGKIEFEAPSQKLQVSIFDLINAVNAILKRFNQKETPSELFEDKWTVSEKIEALAELIHKRPRIQFTELFSESTSRTEVVVTFLALLELIRLKQVSVYQPEPFSDIEIRAAVVIPVAREPSPPAQAEAQGAATTEPVHSSSWN